MPLPIRLACAWAVAVGLLVGGVIGLVLLLAQVGVVVWALMGALLLAALLEPLAARLRDAGLNRRLAASVVFIGFFATVSLVIWLSGRQVTGEFDDLGPQLEEGLQEVSDWITETFPVSGDTLDSLGDQARQWWDEGASGLVGAVSSTAGSVVSIVTGAVLALFVTFFFLSDGRRMWTWIVNSLPSGARDTVDSGGERAWRALVSYMRGIIVVAIADAILIGIALAVLGVPLVWPLIVPTFLGAFIPLVGATLAGAAAVLVALVDQGVGTAILLLVIVIVVQQVDSDILQPLILSRAVALHPVVVALAIAAGGILAGIGGAIVATPIVAAAYATIRPYRTKHEHDRPSPREAPPGPEQPADGG